MKVKQDGIGQVLLFSCSSLLLFAEYVRSKILLKEGGRRPISLLFSFFPPLSSPAAAASDNKRALMAESTG
jgi:hypothetical protein